MKNIKYKNSYLEANNFGDDDDKIIFNKKAIEKERVKSYYWKKLEEYKKEINDNNKNTLRLVKKY